MKENHVLGKNVGIWIRVSTEDQAKGESPAHHLERAKAYAVSRGWTIKEVYDLAGVSGKSVKDHTEAKRMLADVKRGHVNGLIFSKLARLARNTKELLEFSDYFRDHNADLIRLLLPSPKIVSPRVQRRCRRRLGSLAPLRSPSLHRDRKRLVANLANIKPLMILI